MVMIERQLNGGFLVFSGVSEDETYLKMLGQIINHQDFFLIRLNHIFTPYRYGDDYQAVLITLYLGDFELIPSITTLWLSNYSKKHQDWNFKIPIPKRDITILNHVEDFNAFIKANLLELVNILKKRKVKNFDFELFLRDIELI